MTFYIALMFTIVVIWIATLAYFIRQDENRHNFIIRKLETGYPDMEKELCYVTNELEELKRACHKWAESPTTGNEQKIKELLRKSI
jgi:hypothetical protein